jgi:uncharacterized membrane protein
MTWTAAASAAVLAAFLSSLVEAVEALTIVLSVATVRGWKPAGLGAIAGVATLALIVVGAGRGLLVPASIGALAACALVAVVGLVVHRPLALVPENALKFTVGVMLSAFGLFWTGEGLGVSWPGADLIILAFAVLLVLVAALAVVVLKREPQVSS